MCLFYPSAFAFYKMHSIGLCCRPGFNPVSWSMYLWRSIGSDHINHKMDWSSWSKLVIVPCIPPVVPWASLPRTAARGMGKPRVTTWSKPTVFFIIKRNVNIYKACIKSISEVTLCRKQIIGHYPASRCSIWEPTLATTTNLGGWHLEGGLARQ